MASRRRREGGDDDKAPSAPIVATDFASTLRRVGAKIHCDQQSRLAGRDAQCGLPIESSTAHTRLLSWLDDAGVRHKGRSVEAIIADLPPRPSDVCKQLIDDWKRYKAYIYDKHHQAIIAMTVVEPNRFRDEMSALTFETLFTNPYWPPRADRMQFEMLMPDSVAALAVHGDGLSRLRARPRDVPRLVRDIPAHTTVRSSAPVSAIERYIDEWCSLQQSQAALVLTECHYTTTVVPAYSRITEALDSARSGMRAAWPGGDTDSVLGAPVASARDIEPHIEAFMNWMDASDSAAVIATQCRVLTETILSDLHAATTIADVRRVTDNHLRRVQESARSEHEAVAASDAGAMIAAAYKRHCQQEMMHACLRFVAEGVAAGKAAVAAHGARCLVDMDRPISALVAKMSTAHERVRAIHSALVAKCAEEGTAWRTAYKRYIQVAREKDVAAYHFAVDAALDGILASAAATVAAPGANHAMIATGAICSMRKFVGDQSMHAAPRTTNTDAARQAIRKACAAVDATTTAERVAAHRLLSELRAACAESETLSLEVVRRRRGIEHTWRVTLSRTYPLDLMTESVRVSLYTLFAPLARTAMGYSSSIPYADRITAVREWQARLPAVYERAPGDASEVTFATFLATLSPLALLVYAYEGCTQ